MEFGPENGPVQEIANDLNVGAVPGPESGVRVLRTRWWMDLALGHHSVIWGVISGPLTRRLTVYPGTVTFGICQAVCPQIGPGFGHLMPSGLPQSSCHPGKFPACILIQACIWRIYGFGILSLLSASRSIQFKGLGGRWREGEISPSLLWREIIVDNTRQLTGD